MKKTTSQNFSTRLTQYGALTAAMASIAGTNAQEKIVYTDIMDSSGTIYQYYPLDLDNNGNEDFRIVGFPVGGSAYAAAVIYNGSLGSTLPAILSNEFLGSFNIKTYYNSTFMSNYSLTFVYPFDLNQGDLISAAQNSWFDANLSTGTLNFAGCFGGNSNWCGVMDKYVGLRFKIGANTHYGWVRMDVSLDAFTWTIKDYAYHTDPDTPILAGQTTTLGINDNYLSKIRVVALNKSIGIYDLPVATDYKLYNMAGQELMKGATENKDYVIEATNMSSGVYIVELSDAKSNAVIRKKVVLQ